MHMVVPVNVQAAVDLTHPEMARCFPRDAKTVSAVRAWVRCEPGVRLFTATPEQSLPSLCDLLHDIPDCWMYGWIL
jgi:hypothetical protein